ncbi:MAG: IS200/IS605 family element transposase accessory protein TnpB [Candidatus Helarchaeota archaeon]|nr:IS200/IS605 family element transposase accessory protein TnpB [Candidatus Helarchaeota archaeon]
MLTTTIFRLYPSTSQTTSLNEIFTIYNRVKRKGYKLLFNGAPEIQQKLMQACHNNPYVNTIIIENKTKLAQQKTWVQKKAQYLRYKLAVVKDKIANTKKKNPRDRSLRGLYALLSSLQNRVANLTLKPIVFGTKPLFRKRLLGLLSREEFRIRRDASFACIGKVQYGVKNLNLKVLPVRHLKIRTFSKEQGKKWLRIPFSVNPSQASRFREILQLDKYTVVVKRKVVKGELRYFAHMSYESPTPAVTCAFENGGIGLDFNYDCLALVNMDRDGRLLSYQSIRLRNLHSYRKGRRDDYASFKLGKVINYCLNKGKGLIIEDLSFEQSFSYNKKRNRKITQLKTSMLPLLERKCARYGIAVKKVHPAYTTIIGALKHGWSYNLSEHVLASYVIARKGLGFTEDLPACYEWLLAQVGDVVKPRLKPSSPYRQWAQLYDLFKHYGVTPFRSPDPGTNLKRNLLLALDTVLDGLNPATGVPPDNLTAGLLACG